MQTTTHHCPLEQRLASVPGFCDNCEAPALGFYCEGCEKDRQDGFLDIPEPPATVPCPACGLKFFLPRHDCGIQ